MIGLLASATVGFCVASPDHGWFSAFYLTLNVLTTLGAESPVGDEKIVATFLMIGGILTAMYATSAMVSFIVGGELKRYLLKRKMDKILDKLKGHYIVVGFGRMGSALCEDLKERGNSFVLIERDPARVEIARERGYLVVEGDAHHECVYETAKIEEAKGLASCLPGDADNVYVTLTVRGFSRDINITARAEDSKTHTKLMRAGADRVVCPPVLSASKVLSMMVTPEMDFGDHLDECGTNVPIELFESDAEDFPKLIDRSLASNHVRTRTGLTVVAVDRNGKREMNPTALFSPIKGDRLTLVGPCYGMERLKEFFG